MRRLAAFILALWLAAVARPSLDGWRYQIGEPFPYSAWSACHDGSAMRWASPERRQWPDGSKVRFARARSL